MKSVHNAKELPLTAMPIRHGERKFKEYLSLLSESPWFPCRKKNTNSISAYSPRRTKPQSSGCTSPAGKNPLDQREVIWINHPAASWSLNSANMCRVWAHCCSTDSTNNPQQFGNLRHSGSPRVSPPQIWLQQSFCHPVLSCRHTSLGISGVWSSHHCWISL